LSTNLTNDTNSTRLKLGSAAPDPLVWFVMFVV